MLPGESAQLLNGLHLLSLDGLPFPDQLVADRQQRRAEKQPENAERDGPVSPPALVAASLDYNVAGTVRLISSAARVLRPPSRARKRPNAGQVATTRISAKQR
jgi:hypothetical protein